MNQWTRPRKAGSSNPHDTMANPYFTKELFTFLRQLKKNNNRDWFNDNKKRYEEHLKEPLLDFITDFAPLLAQISPHFRAIPKATGG